jgi:spore coat protein A, manganese oxidase
MSKNSRKKNVAERFAETTIAEDCPESDNLQNQVIKTKRFSFLKARALMIAIIGFLTLGTLGAGLKYLEEDAGRELARRANKKGNLNNEAEQFSVLNKLNPFLPAPPPPPTPQLSREYLFAGSRLLSVEDANANAAPPVDLAIWRPTSGEWWVMGGAGSQQVTQAWGANGDTTVPGDYDGDGKTDFSVWRPSNGTWYITNSAGGGGQFPFGQTGDVAAPADFDGDGRTDAAVYRNGTWYILQSSTNQTVQGQFGQTGDIPTPKDFDGDGRADLAVWRGSNSTFYSANSSNGQVQTINLNTASTKPVPADYDGDGKADYAVRSSNNWVILNSSNGQTQTINWQTAGDTAVQNDYDGDGKVDIAVWRNGNGNWYIRQSSKVGQAGELRQVQWGTAGDTPVPLFYRR